MKYLLSIVLAVSLIGNTKQFERYAVNQLETQNDSVAAENEALKYLAQLKASIDGIQENQAQMGELLTEIAEGKRS